MVGANQHLLISVVLATPGGIAEQLFDDARLTFGAGGENAAEFPDAPERRVRHSGHSARGIEIELDGHRLAVPPSAVMIGQESDGEFVAMPADGVEFLKPESDRVHQRMAAGASAIDRV